MELLRFAHSTSLKLSTEGYIQWTYHQVKLNNMRTWFPYAFISIIIKSAKWKRISKNSFSQETGKKGSANKQLFELLVVCEEMLDIASNID